MFKLVTFPNTGNFAYVLIRGTTNQWDMLTDAQLWSAAALMQVHRALLPIGVIWNSSTSFFGPFGNIYFALLASQLTNHSPSTVIDELIKAITRLESKSIGEVSFYKDTTNFVKFIKGQPETYSGVGITGHSLGGGLAIISGAQAKVPAVALSGPNAMLSRKSFDDPISIEDLDSKTFVSWSCGYPFAVICFGLAHALPDLP